MRTTLKDIAERVGVTKALVSLYLNNHPLSAKIAKTTKEKIDKAVKELNYQPSTMARAFRNGKTRTIGLIIGEICGDYSSFLAQSLLFEALKYGYQLQISVTRFNAEEEIKCWDNLINRQIDGIISALGYFPEEYIRKNGLENYPILQLSSGASSFNCVKRNESAGLKLGLQMLKEHGCRNVVSIAMPTSKWNIFSAEFCQSLGMNMTVKNSTYDIYDQYLDLCEEISREKPDAVICGTSTVVRTIIDYLIKNKVKKRPKFLYSYTLPCDYIDSPCVAGVVTTPFREFIETAMKRIVEMIEHPETEKKRIEFPSEFMDRDGLKKYFYRQLSDPYYVPFITKMHRYTTELNKKEVTQNGTGK